MAERRRVRFSEYALLRMWQRDILDEEVRRALDRPSSAHRHRPDGRSQVRLATRGKTLLVIYRRRKRDRLVINAMWE